MKIIRFIALIICAALLAVTPIFVIPAINKTVGFGIVKESKYKGVLILWHIETFEGGSSSRANYLESVARELEKAERNLFVLVRTMDVDTLTNLLSDGSRPDLISFGTGLGGTLQNLLTDIGDDFGVQKKYAESGVSGRLQLAVPYMAGGYALIGCEEMLKRAGVTEEIKMSDSLNIELNERNKKIPALTVGANCHIKPRNALEYNGAAVMEQYDAYESFMLRKSIMLLGTQRDVNRLINREELGKGRAVRYEFLNTYTDLVQYLGIMTEESYKREAAKLFIAKVLSDYGQSRLGGTGLFSVTGGKMYTAGAMSDMENALKDEDLRVAGVF